MSGQVTAKFQATDKLLPKPDIGGVSCGHGWRDINLSFG